MIQLNSQHLQTIREHAESIYPQECCGIILGHIDDAGKTVVEVMPTENSWNTEAGNFPSQQGERRRYAIAPQIMLQAQKLARDRHLNIIGIYHSHPDYPAMPSEFDRIYAWQEYSYIIISVQNGHAGELTSWSLDDDHQFQQEVIEKLV